MPKILLMALIARAELAQLDDSALNELARYYEAIWHRLDGQFGALTRQIEEAQAAGKLPVLRVPGSGVPLEADEFSANWLYRQRRYYALMDQLEAEMSRLGIASIDITTKQQRNALLLGLDHASRLQIAALPDDIARLGATWNRVPFDALESMIGFVGDGSPLAYKFADMPAQIADAVRQTLITGIATGRNPRRVAADAKTVSDGALVNALTTCRTETSRAYRTASMQTYRANADVVDGWVWMCARQARTCAACWGMDGLFFPLSVEFVDHPNGRCTALPVTKPWSELGVTGIKERQVRGWDSETHFRKLSEADQRMVLGRSKFEAWQSGELKLRDIPVLEPSAVWGDHYRVQTLQELGIERWNSSSGMLDLLNAEDIAKLTKSEYIAKLEQEGAIRTQDVPAKIHPVIKTYEELQATTHALIGDSESMDELEHSFVRATPDIAGEIKHGRVSINKATGQPEAGLSATGIRPGLLTTRREVAQLMLGEPTTYAKGNALETGLPSHVYIIDGKKVGTGSDNEPLLDPKSVRVVAQIHDDLVNGPQPFSELSWLKHHPNDPFYAYERAVEAVSKKRKLIKRTR